MGLGLLAFSSAQITITKWIQHSNHRGGAVTHFFSSHKRTPAQSPSVFRSWDYAGSCTHSVTRKWPQVQTSGAICVFCHVGTVLPWKQQKQKTNDVHYQKQNVQAGQVLGKSTHQFSAGTEDFCNTSDFSWALSMAITSGNMGILHSKEIPEDGVLRELSHRAEPSRLPCWAC